MDVLWLFRLGGLPLLASAIVGLVLAAVLVAIYRLTIHPLARFPGPSLAAATGLYEAYFQCLKDGGGRYWVEIEKMHRTYGAVAHGISVCCSFISSCWLTCRLSTPQVR